METKEYTIDQEQLARFAKAMGHPARIAILNFLANRIVVFSVTSMRSYPYRRPPFPSI